jgi:hypothetical protein
MIPFRLALDARRLGMAVVAAASLAVIDAAPASAQTCAATSSPRMTALVELYTSEGCNSCPPADRWLSSTVPAGANSASVAALAFHVDYWDRLGWKDRFAAPAWTERQYAMAHANRTRLVFTPQVLVQGHDFPDWRDGKSAAALAAIAARPARARIAIEAQPQRGTIAVKASASVQAASDRRNAALFVALADSRLVSDVKAGENAGVRLTHDHVVRALRGGMAVDAGGDASGDVAFAVPAETGVGATIVAFVQNTENGDVLQALALPLASSACATPR